MKIFRTQEDSLKFGLSFFLILGAVLGSVFCNGMTPEMKQELCAVEQRLVNGAAHAQMNHSELIFRILPKRLGVLGLLFLISMTQSAPLLLSFMAGYFGFTIAVMVCSLTMKAGVLGIFQYVLLVFPQCLFYVPVGYVLLWWMPVNRRRLTKLAAAVLALAVSGGVLAESMLNSWFLRYL